jgi:hypothetical protein
MIILYFNENSNAKIGILRISWMVTFGLSVGSESAQRGGRTF